MPPGTFTLWIRLTTGSGRSLPAATINTIAGSGANGSAGDGGAAISASLNHPQGIALDASGVLYIADTSNDRIRTVSPDGIISTVAGNGFRRL